MKVEIRKAKMSRKEIREKYDALMKEVVKGNFDSGHAKEEFIKLNQICPHPYGELNYEIGCWACPDCGLRNPGIKS